MATNYKILGQNINTLQIDASNSSSSIISELKIKNTSYPTNLDVFVASTSDISNAEYVLSNEEILDQDILSGTSFNSRKPTLSNIWYRRYVIRFVYSAEEISSAIGATSGTIDSISFYNVQQPANQPLPDYAIGIQEGVFDELSSSSPGFSTSGFTVVKNPSSESFVSGTRKTFNFDVPFNWNGGDLAFSFAWGQCPEGYSDSGGGYYSTSGYMFVNRSDAAGSFDVNHGTYGTSEIGRPIIALNGNFVLLSTYKKTFEKNYLVKGRPVSYDEEIKISGGIALESGQSLVVETAGYNPDTVIIQAYGIEETV